MRIKVGFVENDRIYMERLVAALNRFYSDKLEIYSYTDVETANENVENQRLDIVIVDEKLEVKEFRNCCTALFVGASDIDRLEGKKAICKFQKVELIYKDILSVYSEYSQRITKRKQTGELAEVITFTSPIGGCGTTSVAAAFAINCALNNKSAIYLNMETIDSTDIVFSGDSKYTFTDVVYAVKSKRANISMKLESCAVTDAARVDFFAPPTNPMDAHELNEEDIETLISELRTLGLYDYIVVDSGFSISKNYKKLMECSNKKVFVVGNDEKTLHKLDKLRTLMTIYMQDENFVGNSYVIVNNIISSGHAPDWSSFNVAARFDKVTGSNYRQIVDLLANSQQFLNLY
ncbi:MAG: hypothetical protein ACI4EF_12510 [Coprococcus sp.]